MRARDNPFRVSCVLRVRYRFLFSSWPEFLARLESMNHRGAVVGPEGSGKTTLLEDLDSRLAGRGLRSRWLRFTDATPPLARPALEDILSDLDRSCVVFVDGADLMDRAAWLGLLSRTVGVGGLVVACHRPGLLPTLIETAVTIDLFRGIVREILGPADLPEGIDLGALLERNGGNARRALMALYDVYAEGKG